MPVVIALEVKRLLGQKWKKYRNEQIPLLELYRSLADMQCLRKQRSPGELGYSDEEYAVSDNEQHVLQRQGENAKNDKQQAR